MTEPNNPPAAEPAAPGKPEFLPDEFWNAESGAPDVEGLWNAYSLKPDESVLRERLEPELRNKLEAERIAKRPENVDGYELKLPEGFEVPEGLEASLDGLVDDPLAQWWRTTAFELGLNQDEFAAGIAAAAKAELVAVEARKAEMAKLGDNAEKRLERVVNWLEMNLGADAAKAVTGALSTAATVEAFERMVGRLHGKLPDSARMGASVKTPEQLRQMMEDPRYQTDPLYRDQVTKEYQRTHGTAQYRGSPGVPA